MNTLTHRADLCGNREAISIPPITISRVLLATLIAGSFCVPLRAQVPPGVTPGATGQTGAAPAESAIPGQAAEDAVPDEPARPDSIGTADADFAFTIAAPVPRPAAPWESRRFDYAVVDQDLRDVLAEFGRRVGLSVSVSDAVHGRVRGRLPALPARALLEQLATMHGFDWFSDGATLHISASSEAVSRLIELGHVSPRALAAALGGLGIVDERWPIRIAPGGLGLALIAGPPRYVALIEQTLAALARRDAPPPGAVPAGTIRIFRGRTERGT